MERIDPTERTGSSTEILDAIVERSSRGDRDAFRQLYDETRRKVFGILQRFLGRRELAEEVLVDVYAQAWRQAATFDRARGTALAWLASIARSRAIDRLRSLRRESNATLGTVDELPGREVYDRHPTPLQAVQTNERRLRIAYALEGLCGEQRSAIELAFLSGMSHTQIAERLALPLGTVKTRIRMGLAELRRKLADEGSERANGEADVR